MSMEHAPTALPGVFLLRSPRTVDARGSFERLWSSQEAAAALGMPAPLLQASLARNTEAGTLRGLHFAIYPQYETKFVRCIAGSVFDVVVDLRPGSPTAGRAIGIKLDADGCDTLCIPPGFAHGYQTLRDDTRLLYFMDRPYLADCAKVLRYDDPALAVAWPAKPRNLSNADRHGLSITQALALVEGAADGNVQYPVGSGEP